MTSLAIAWQDAAHLVAPEDWRRNIVVATDGRAASDTALIAARDLAGLAPFGVVSVLAEAASKDRTAGWMPLPDTPDAHRTMVAAQVRRVLGECPDLWIEVRRGYPPAALTSFAELHRVSLLITGIGRPKVLDRLLGDESTLRIARMAQSPLYAVARHCAAPPRRIIIGTDSSMASMRAARLAIAIAAPRAEVTLAHVHTPAGRYAPEDRVRRQAEKLQERFSGRVIPVELTGDAASELLGLATSIGADAIAIGAHGHGEPQRCTLGPVATRVVRCAPCSVILAPSC
jgi:nucleotide-binding universal stress UspA family protein